MIKEKLKQIVIIVMLLIAIINLGCLMKLFFFKNVNEMYVVASIFVILLQIVVIIISIIHLKKFLNTKLSKFLTLTIVVIIIITFFIPVQTYQVSNKSDKYGLSPSVMPYKGEINLYGITLTNTN